MSGALNSFGSLATLVVGGRKYRYHSLNAFAETARVRHLDAAVRVCSGGHVDGERGGEVHGPLQGNIRQADVAGTGTGADAVPVAVVDVGRCQVETEVVHADSDAA